MENIKAAYSYIDATVAENTTKMNDSVISVQTYDQGYRGVEEEYLRELEKNRMSSTLWKMPEN